MWVCLLCVPAWPVVLVVLVVVVVCVFDVRCVCMRLYCVCFVVVFVMVVVCIVCGWCYLGGGDVCVLLAEILLLCAYVCIFFVLALRYSSLVVVGVFLFRVLVLCVLFVLVLCSVCCVYFICV